MDNSLKLAIQCVLALLALCDIVCRKIVKLMRKVKNILSNGF